jgi:hypothetical protein
MSDVGPLKPLIHTNPVRPVNRDPAKKEQEKKKKGKELPQQEEDGSNEHVDEYI